MVLIINGEKQEFDEGSTITQILTKLNITKHVMAVALNMNIVKKQDWDTTIPQENDKLEFLQFVGGG